MTPDPEDVVATALMVYENCDREQAKDPERQWENRFSPEDRQEYRELADAALAALAEQGLVLVPVSEVKALIDGLAANQYEHWCEAEDRSLGNWGDLEHDTRDAWRDLARAALTWLREQAQT